MAIADDPPITRTTAFWHPVRRHGRGLARASSLIERGEGVWVFDADGRRYLDGTASLWYANLGHGRARGRRRGRAPRCASSRPTRRSATSATAPANELAERLAAHAPMDDARVFLASGGGDAIDTAAKIARRHWIQQRPARARAPDQPHAGLPRHARLRHVDRRHRGQRVQLGPAGPAGLAPSRTTRCPRWRRRSSASGPTAWPRSSASR